MGTFPFGARSFFAGVWGGHFSCAGWRSSGILELCVPHASMPLPSCSDNQSQMSPQGVVGGAKPTLVENTVLRSHHAFLDPALLLLKLMHGREGPCRLERPRGLWGLEACSLSQPGPLLWQVLQQTQHTPLIAGLLNWLSLAGSDMGIPSSLQTYVPAFLVQSWWGDTCSGGPV